MYMKKIMLFLAISCSLQLMAVNLSIQKTDNTQRLQDITKIGKLIFVENDLQLLDKAGKLLASEPITSIRKIIFVESQAAALESVETEMLLVYPNPTQATLFIKGIDAQVIRVYDLNGRLLLSEYGTQVNVSELSLGTYLLQIGTQVVRFIKN